MTFLDDERVCDVAGLHCLSKYKGKSLPRWSSNRFLNIVRE